MGNKKALLAVVVLSALIVFAYPIMSNAKLDISQITVSPGESIQSAINDAQEGDMILIQNGIHREGSYPILVNKSVTLVGENVDATIIDGGGTIKGVFLVKAAGAKIFNLTIQNTTIAEGGDGVRLYNIKNVEIVNCKIRSCSDGIRLRNSTYCNITRNKIVNNYARGIYLHENSSFNVLAGNNISTNPTGIRIADLASGWNRIFHNNFINNIYQRSEVGIGGTWDNGYPSGGNHWSDYNETDQHHGSSQNELGSDGIGDISYEDTDNYPFTAPIHFFNAGRWNEKDYCVVIASNSTVSDFSFYPDIGTFIKFNVTGSAETKGLCRVTIPKQMLWIENWEQWIVLINEIPKDYLVLDDLDYTYLYFTFNHSTQTVKIWGTHAVPEWQIVSILMFMAIFLCGAILAKKKNWLNLSRRLFS